MARRWFLLRCPDGWAQISSLSKSLERQIGNGLNTPWRAFHAHVKNATRRFDNCINNSTSLHAMHYIVPSFKTRKQDERPAGPTLSVAAIHDDFTAGIRAKEALLWLKHSLSDMQVRSTFWSFQSLERPDVRAVSLREAATADVLIIAASEKEAVPDQIRSWIDFTLQEQEGSRAVLVVLHEGDDTACDEPGPLCSYVEKQACRWRTECMCNHAFDQRLDRDYAMRLIGQRKSMQPSRQPIHEPAPSRVGNALLGPILKAFTFLVAMACARTGCAEDRFSL